jgi:transposase
MGSEEIFSLALGLAGSGWKLVGSEFGGEPKGLELRLEYEVGRRWECPECGEECSAYDGVEKRWRHLNFFQYRCEIVAKVPRADCQRCGVRQVKVPWAREGSGFTLLFEAFVMMLAREMPVAAVAEAVGEEDTRMWRMIRHLVEQAHAKSDWSHVRYIAVDETSSRKGKRYVTVFLESESRKVLFIAEGRSGQAVAEFRKALEARGGDARKIERVVMDMLHCYKRGVRENFPNAQIVFDRYHVMVMAGEAVDEVRRSLQRQGADLKGGMWALRGNEWNLTQEQRERRGELARTYKEIGRALALRTALQDGYMAGSEGPQSLEWWCRWAKRSRLVPFQKLADTIRGNWDGIVAFFECHLTQGAIEAINGIIQLAKRRARGFRNFTYLRTIAYWVTGKLQLDLPSLLPT